MRVAGVLGMSALVSGVLPSISFATPSSEKKAEAQAAFNDLQALQSQLDIRAAEYGQAMIELENLKKETWDTQFRMDDANSKIEGLQDRLSTRARSMYRTGSASLLDLLVGATSFKAFATNWTILNDMSESDAALVAETKALRDQIVSEKAKLDEQKAQAQKIADAAYQMQIDAQLLVDEMQATYNRLSAEAQELLEQEEAAHEAEMRAMVNEQISTGNFSTESSGAPRPNTHIDNSKPQFIPGELVVERAMGEMGKPYLWGACGPNSFDCSGLVSYCLCGEYGKRLGTTNTFYYWTRVTVPQPGDICVNWGHCGIYIGDGQMIHAPQTGKDIQIGSVRPSMIFVRF